MHNILLIVLTVFIQSSAWAASSVRMLGKPIAVSTTGTQPVSSAQPVTTKSTSMRKATLPTPNRQPGRTATVGAASGEAARLATTSFSANKKYKVVSLGGNKVTSTPQPTTGVTGITKEDFNEMLQEKFNINNMEKENGICDVITGFDEKTGKITCGPYKTAVYNENKERLTIQVTNYEQQ